MKKRRVKPRKSAAEHLAKGQPQTGVPEASLVLSQKLPPEVAEEMRQAAFEEKRKELYDGLRSKLNESTYERELRLKRRESLQPDLLEAIMLSRTVEEYRILVPCFKPIGVDDMIDTILVQKIVEMWNATQETAKYLRQSLFSITADNVPPTSRAWRYAKACEQCLLINKEILPPEEEMPRPRPAKRASDNSREVFVA